MKTKKRSNSLRDLKSFCKRLWRNSSFSRNLKSYFEKKNPEPFVAHLCVGYYKEIYFCVTLPSPYGFISRGPDVLYDYLNYFNFILPDTPVCIYDLEMGKSIVINGSSDLIIDCREMEKMYIEATMANDQGIVTVLAESDIQFTCHEIKNVSVYSNFPFSVREILEYTY